MNTDEYKIGIGELKLLNKAVHHVIRVSRLVHEDTGKLLKAFQDEIKSLKMKFEKLSAEKAIVYHLYSKVSGDIIDLFISIKSIVSVLDDKKKKYTLGKINIEIVRRPERSENEVICETIGVKMVRGGVKDYVQELFSEVNPSLCAYGYGWIFMCYLKKSLFEETKSRVVIPLLYYSSKKEYKEKIVDIYQLNSAKILAPLELRQVGSK